ncbi:glycosyltransferase family 4 protein [Aerolutibacter daejeonensis]|uniref:glycosyltransferase family 4 protein n=1 Tax=Aerolutibacter daejeonensis TaxID=346181 RepID=UPI0018DB41AA|nr:glycosyltransferase family 4 protein [Lysobacter daejeonensis]
MPTVRAGSGTDVFAERLAQGLRRHGCEVIVSWLKHGFELYPPAARLRPPAGTTLIHANSWSAFAYTDHGLPTVATDHGFVHDPAFVRIKSRPQRIYHNLLIGRYVRASLEGCTAVTAVSHYLARQMRPFCSRTVAVIPNWVDITQFKPSTRARRNGRLRVLYAGTRSFRKGFDVLRALVAEEHPGIEFWCRSDFRNGLGHYRSDMKFFAKQSAVQMPALYAECDVVLMPSRYEGFGYVAAEAMACARPVIGFDCGALKEVCGEANAELLAPLNDVPAIQEAIYAMAMDRSLVARYGEMGRQRVVENYTEERAIASYIDVYERVL